MKTLLLCMVLLLVALVASSQTRPIKRGEKISDLPVHPAQTVVAPTNVPLAGTSSVSAEQSVGFEVLAGFAINVTGDLEFNTNETAWADAQIKAMFPTNVLQLDGRMVSIDGYMTPLRFDNGQVIEFMLSRYPPACCFGAVPQIHEWIKIRVPLPGTEATDYEVVRVRGRLHVGAHRVDGMLSDIYSMDAESVKPAR